MNYALKFLLVLGLLLSGGLDGICEELCKTCDGTLEETWGDDFSLVEIPSGSDGHVQMAYLYGSKASAPAPLVVSLHTWSGDYTQEDRLSNLCKSKNLNYIHPDFRGVNNTVNACCSELAMSDIDEAISYAIENTNVDISRIYVVGHSGGGYATLATFMKSKHKIKKFSAWVPISDLEAWYRESYIRGNKYAMDILACTNSEDSILNVHNAKDKSPLYWETPGKKLNHSKLNIYTGIYDGIQGSVPITQSVNFYNKVLSDLGVKDASKFVSDQEKLELLEYRKKLGDYGKIAQREVFLKKEYKNLKLVIFEGNHEILPDYALEELLLD